MTMPPAKRAPRHLCRAMRRRAGASCNVPKGANVENVGRFWNFVPGPLNAGTFGPAELDNTFGPEVKFFKAPAPDRQNAPPSAGMQFFGHVQIEGASGQMTVTLRDRADVALWSTTLDPKTR